MVVPRLKDMLTDLSDIGPITGLAVVGVRRKRNIHPHLLDGGHDRIHVLLGNCTEPPGVSVFGFEGIVALDMLNLDVGHGELPLGVRSGLFDSLQLLVRAVFELPFWFHSRFRSHPLVVDVPGGNEITRAFGLGNVPNRGVGVLGGAVSIDVGEVVRRFDRVVSGSGLDEAVRSGD